MSGPTATEVTTNDDLFGDSAGNTTTLEQEPGTEETSGEEVETAADEPEGEVEGNETESAEAEAEPTNVEVLKILAKKGISESKFNEYLTRYKLTAEQANANPSIAHLVLDKAAADELIAKAPKEEVKKEEVKQNPPTDLDAHFKTVLERANTYTDPKVMDYAVTKLEAAKNTREQLDALMGFMENYLETALPQKFPNVLQGFTSAQEKANNERIAAHNSAWEPIQAGNPNLKDKDALTAYTEAEKLEPELVQNAALTPAQRMKTVALVLGGRKAEAEVVAAAAEKGKEQGAKAAKKEALGKLGAGQSTGAIAKKTTGNDDIFGAPGEVAMTNRLVSKKP